MKLERRTIAAMAALAVLAACGGGGNSAPPETVERTARALAGPELPGGHCPAGGARIDAGIDSDGNGVLDAGEIASTQYVCDGATGVAGATGPAGLAGAPGIAGPMGPSGVAALVQMSAESAGAHCTSGGTRIAAGADVNGNGVLDPVEVTSVGYVCAAADGVYGHDNLMRMATEGASVACPSGGSRIESGRDGDRNGSLDLGEVTATALVCNGATGANGTNGTNGTNGANGASGYASLTHSVAESAGANCAAGGIKITSGADTDRDGMLDDPGEVTATSYVCNGFGAWVEVTAVAVQSEPNTGYVASSGTEVTVTLPANPNVGDVVRVSGAGTGGWRIAQNPGQSIVTAHLDVASVAKAWTVNGYAGDYRAVASSADGNRLFATQPMDFPVVSADAGLTWSVVGPGMGNWNSLASSADGRRLVLAGGGEHIYVSDDFGATWAARETPRGWTAVAMSADGRVIASTVVGQQVFVSTDYGVTWAARGASRFWSAIAMSADGSRIAAAENGGQIDISSDYGASWTSHAGALSWRSLASSADGRRLVAVAENAPIYTSEDFGVSWTARDSARLWAGVASSADGNRLVAVASGDANAAQYDPDFIYASSDQGLTWTRRGTADAWAGVASSADGSRLAAVTNGYGSFSFWTSVPAPVAITTAGSGWIAGKQYQAIELQYVGGNRFMVLDAIGSGFEAQ